MAGNLRGFALQKAELLSGHLREMLSSGQGYILTHLGVDLGLEPELYPTWLVLSTAAVALLLPLLLLAVSWAAVCGALLSGKRRRSPADGDVCQLPAKATLSKSVNAEQQQQQQQAKKKGRKKAAEKVTQPNGLPVSLPQGDQVTRIDPEPPRQNRTNKELEVQAPVQLQKGTKVTGAATDVRPVPFIVTDDLKEPDEGAWQTIVSQREKKKKQQRRKNNGHEESDSAGWSEVPASTKRNRNYESMPKGWTEASTKILAQLGDAEGTKWSGLHTAVHYRAAKHQSWTQDRQAWSSVDGQIKNDLNSIPLRINPAEPAQSVAELQWVSQPHVDDEWSGFNGMASIDPSSDWNAPAEHWGNYNEVSALPKPPAKGQSAANKDSDDEKDVDNPADGSAKSKKRRKKKKKTQDEGGEESQPVSAAPEELPTFRKQPSSVTPPAFQKRSEPVAEPPRASQKKKVRWET